MKYISKFPMWYQLNLLLINFGVFNTNTNIPNIDTHNCCELSNYLNHHHLCKINMKEHVYS